MLANSMSSWTERSACFSASFACMRRRAPGLGPIRSTSWLGSGRGASFGTKPSQGVVLKTTRTSVTVTGSDFPARMKNGTPDQRQLSISSRIAQKVSVCESGATPSTSR